MSHEAIRDAAGKRSALPAAAAAIAVMITYRGVAHSKERCKDAQRPRARGTEVRRDVRAPQRQQAFQQGPAESSDNARRGGGKENVNGKEIVGRRFLLCSEEPNQNQNFDDVASSVR